MNLKKTVSAVTNAFKSGGVQPSEPTNTHVTLASQSEPAADEPRADHGERDGDGSMPASNALVSDRSQALKEIFARRNAQAVSEADESLPQTDENGEEVESNPVAPPADGEDLDAAPQEQTPDAGASTVAAQPAPVVAAPAAPVAPEETRTLVIDGQPVQVPISKLVETGTRALQKELAADVRLNQATQILEEAKRVASQPAAPAQPSFADKTPEELAELIQFGNRTEAAEAIKFLMRPSAAQVKPEEIVRAAQKAVAPAIAFEEGKKYVRMEYGDLLDDPDLGAIFLNRENALRAAKDQRGYVELYKAIGDDMRVKFNRPKPGTAALPPAQQPSTPTRTFEEKRQLKAAAPAAPRLASARLDGEGTQTKPPTRAQVFDSIRAARGFKRHADNDLH